jgi:hypothetical protein
MSDHALFTWRHCEADIILCAGRWYVRDALRYRTVEERMRERGVLNMGTDFSCAEYAAGTFDDWRLPNVKELQSLIYFGRVNPALPATAMQHKSSVSLFQVKMALRGAARGAAGAASVSGDGVRDCTVPVGWRYSP